jgi:transposase
MRFDLENLPSDTALLRRLMREMAVVVDGRDDEIERLQLIIKKLQRAQFGASLRTPGCRSTGARA